MWLSSIGLLVTFGISLLWTPLVATAQQPGKVYRIGFLSTFSPPLPLAPTPVWDAFWQGMRERGWIEGQNIVVERRWAEGRIERLPALAMELVQLKVDLIVAGASLETRAAKQATSTIPIVMVSPVDAVKIGLVASLAHPGANVTGTTMMASDLDSKRLEFLKETVPGSSRIAEAVTRVAATEERWWAAEVYRLQGALLLQRPVPDGGQAEACFQQALDVARRQQARALELRAALSLACLWQQQGKRTKAYELLAPIYDWFTEGFDTADLQEARALLAALT